MSTSSKRALARPGSNLVLLSTLPVGDHIATEAGVPAAQWLDD